MSRQFSCTFAKSIAPFILQAKARNRCAIVPGGVRLTTRPGDNDVAGSGDWERSDLQLSQELTDGYQGRESWWSHRVKYPGGYNAPPRGGYVVMDFHHAYPTGQANFHLDSDNWEGNMQFRGYGGSKIDGGEYKAVIGPIVKNVWYEFVYHVRWSSGSDGFMQAWVNGKLLLDHKGPTLYSLDGKVIGCYLKLANYHSAFGKSSSIIHGRVSRGTTAADVARTPLQGVS